MHCFALNIVQPQRPEPQQQELFHDVPDKSEMVRELLTQVFTPHSSGVREVRHHMTTTRTNNMTSRL